MLITDFFGGVVNRFEARMLMRSKFACLTHRTNAGERNSWRNCSIGQRNKYVEMETTFLLVIC